MGGTFPHLPPVFMDFFYVYILESVNNSEIRYYGFTENLCRSSGVAALQYWSISEAGGQFDHGQQERIFLETEVEIKSAVHI